MVGAMCAALTLLSPAPTMEARAKDWTLGPVVYQVMVDRFAPPADLDAKRRLLAEPRVVKPWSETPRPGRRLDDLGVWTHELEFWGGDLASLRGKLDYIQGLGADVLYLQPIHAAFTNHKYDAQDFRQISPEIGTREDLRGLIRDVHGRRMKIMLDGVFNHMGRTSPRFQEALKDPKSRYRNWFVFGEGYERGYQAWFNVGNLPVLNLENPAVREYLWKGRDGVVRDYLKDGIDGWRLDVAFELGPAFLAELTKSAKETRNDSVVVGEINGYPADWFPSVDGVFNFYAGFLGREALNGQISGGRVGAMLDDMVADAGLDNLLRSWLVLDNHDTPRLASVFPDQRARQFLQALQFSLPGSPVVYYGTELGMTGAGDPSNRAPMRWDLVLDTNSNLAWVRRLIAERREHPALRYGDFRSLRTEKLLAYLRTTHRFKDSVLVVANPTEQPVKETFAVRLGKLMSWGELRDVFTNERARSVTGLLTVEVPPRTVRWYVPVTEPVNGHSPYGRIGG